MHSGWLNDTPKQIRKKIRAAVTRLSVAARARGWALVVAVAHTIWSVVLITAAGSEPDSDSDSDSGKASKWLWRAAKAPTRTASRDCRA